MPPKRLPIVSMGRDKMLVVSVAAIKTKIVPGTFPSIPKRFLLIRQITKIARLASDKKIANGLNVPIS